MKYRYGHPVNRFIKNIDDCSDSNKCWEWNKAIRHGYGVTWLLGKSWQAHRASYQLFCGDIPKGMLICHKCDNKKCVNPNHLFLGTSQDNTQDGIKKGRILFGKGEKCVNHKLTNKDVLQIRKLISEKTPYSVLCNMFNISRSAISSIKTRKSWGHLYG